MHNKTVEMEAITEYLFEEEEDDATEDVIPDTPESSISEEERFQTGYIHINDSLSDGSIELTPRSKRADGKDLDHDISGIKVEIHRSAPSEYLQGTVYTPHPPSHPHKGPDIPYVRPYYETRGEVSGHFEQDQLSSDIVTKAPSSLLSSRRSSHVKFRNGSSHDSGVCSQATSQRTPSSCGSRNQDFIDITALEEYSIDSNFGSRRNSQMSTLSKSSSIKSNELSNHYRDEACSTAMGDSSIDALENMSLRLDFSHNSGSISTHMSNTNQTKKGGCRGLTRRQFHRGSYVRARYSSQINEEKSCKSKQKYKPPKSLCPASRYGKEARIVAPKPKMKQPKQWPEPPRYPPKARHASTECDILRLVETLDLGVQCTSETQDREAQCTVQMVETQTQYPRTRVKNFCSQTDEKKTNSVSIQNTPSTRNRMVETSTRILYFPEINTANAKVQTNDSTFDNENQTDSIEKTRTLTRQDSIEIEKQKIKDKFRGQKSSSSGSSLSSVNKSTYSSSTFTSETTTTEH